MSNDSKDKVELSDDLSAETHNSIDGNEVNGNGFYPGTGDTEEIQGSKAEWGKHPNSLAALEPTTFQKGKSGNPNGRPKGSPNRSTVFKKLMKVRVEVNDPSDPSKMKKMTLYEAAALGQLLSAKKGNTRAWKEIQDTLHGPIPNKVEGNINLNFATLAKTAEEDDDGSEDDS